MPDLLWLPEGICHTAAPALAPRKGALALGQIAINFGGGCVIKSAELKQILVFFLANNEYAIEIPQEKNTMF